MNTEIELYTHTYQLQKTASPSPHSNSNQSGSRLVMSHERSRFDGTRNIGVKFRTWNDEVKTEAAISIARLHVYHLASVILFFEWTIMWLCDMVVVWPLTKWLLLNTSYTLLNIVLRVLTFWPTFIEAQASIAGQPSSHQRQTEQFSGVQVPNPRHRKWSSTLFIK